MRIIDSSDSIENDMETFSERSQNNIPAVGIDDKILLVAYPKEFYHLCQS